MKKFYALFLWLPLGLFGQNRLPIDSLKITDIQDFLVDDYGNAYIYKSKDFSFTKYDSTGVQKGKVMLTVPFRVQSVQNPLNIVFFSENAQQIKMMDQYLTEIQKIEWQQQFGFIREAYMEDQQIVWLLEDSNKRLIQFNYRENRVINAFPQFWDFDEVKEMLVFEGKVYLLTKDQFVVRSLRGEILYSENLQEGIRLRRENDWIYINTPNSMWRYRLGTQLQKVFEVEGSKIVDKNSHSFFVLKANNLYLYTPQKAELISE